MEAIRWSLLDNFNCLQFCDRLLVSFRVICLRSSHIFQNDLVWKARIWATDVKTNQKRAMKKAWLIAMIHRIGNKVYSFFILSRFFHFFIWMCLCLYFGLCLQRYWRKFYIYLVIRSPLFWREEGEKGSLGVVLIGGLEKLGKMYGVICFWYWKPFCLIVWEGIIGIFKGRKRWK